MKYNNVYWSEQAMQLDQVSPDILAIGDSWFWYPFPGGSLINPIGDLLAAQGHIVYVVGNNGAEAYDYVKGKYRRPVREMLRLYGSAAKAVLVSGGGNDFAGFNDLRPMLNADCSAATTAAECFKPGDAEGTLEWLMQRVFENYALLASRTMLVVPPTTPILVHAYDYAVPDGRGVGGGNGWLKPSLEDARVPVALHQDCIRLLIDSAQSVMAQLAASSNGRVVAVDSRGTLSPADWSNELHPKRAGFKKIAVQKWRPVLQQLGLA
jgi:hypothetical protein